MKATLVKTVTFAGSVGANYAATVELPGPALRVIESALDQFIANYQRGGGANVDLDVAVAIAPTFREINREGAYIGRETRS